MQSANLGVQNHETHGLDQIVVASRIDRPVQILVRLHRAEEDDRDPIIALALPHPLRGLVSVHDRHHDVYEDQLRLLFRKKPEGLFSVFRLDHGVSHAPDQIRHAGTDGAGIIDDEDFHSLDSDVTFSSIL